MGYGTRDGGGRTFWPDDTDTVFFLVEGATLAEIQEKIDDKWPGASSTNIHISAEQFHTDCLGYDRYDPGDYTTFIKLRRLPGA